MFQRSANWVAPKEDTPYTPEQIARHMAEPDLVWNDREHLYKRVDAFITFSNERILRASENAVLEALKVATAKGGSVPREFIPAVEKGLKMQKEDGVLARFPTVDFKATLVDGSYHDVDSNALTFEIAAKAAFREAIKKAGPILLEPVMKVEVVTPGDYLGDVIGDINRRRGSIQDQLERGANIAVVATVPLSEMFGYIGQLRAMSSGRASYTMEFSHYDPVPRNVADEVIEASKKPTAA